MKTYQDLLLVTTDQDLIQFVRTCINEHKTSKFYQNALIAEEYDRHENRTILQYQKILYDIAGRAVPDNFNANFKLASNFFNRFVTQENQYLLGNGVTWTNEKTKDKLGEDFDTVLQRLGKMALVGGVAFGYYNYDHLEAFAVTEFVPLYDEDNGALMAGIRFWQVAANKPLRATLYEVDGYTDFIWNQREGENRDSAGKIMNGKRNYIAKFMYTPVDGEEIYGGRNYPSFPIIPLWGNPKKQSELVGLREQIDCYDLIKSGYADNVDDGSLIYWTLQNAGGMDQVDLAEFVRRMRTVHAATVDDDATAESHTVESPYQSREALLATLRADLYEDAMALDTKNIADGAITATQIRAAYEPLNSKTDQYEYCIREFLNGLMKIAGIEDDPTFTRSVIVNSQEEIQLVLQSAQYLPDDYITTKILTLLGDGDLADDIVAQNNADELKRYNEETE